MRRGLAVLATSIVAACAVPQNARMVYVQPGFNQPRPVVVQPQVMPAPMSPMVMAGPGMLPPSVARAFPVRGNMFPRHPQRAPTRGEMAALGERVQPNGLAAGCNVDMVLDRDQFLANIPRLTALGLLNPQITPQFAQAQILSVAMAFALQAAPVIAHEFLLQPSAPFSCHFRQALVVPGAAGPELRPMFEFDMSRAVDAQAQWPRLLSIGFSYQDANQFVSAAPNFHLAPGVVDRIRQENGA